MTNIKILFSISCILIIIMSLHGYDKSNSHLNTKNNPISFVAIGDTPYTKDEEFQLNNKIIPYIQNGNYPFIVVHGDILNGGESCTNKLLTNRLNTFYNIKKDHVFYTPGDNDWTDCDRIFRYKSYSELERLEYIRTFIASHKPNLPKEWKYKRQKKLIENASWYYEGIQFATIHIVDTRNGRIEILKDNKNKALDQVDSRDQANQDWLDKTFKDARNNNAQAVVIISQANISKSKYKNICSKTKRVNCNPFKSFKNYLQLKAKQFLNDKSEHKPVLFLHGGSKSFCFDKRFGKDIAPNLWRLNAWGDYKPHADATVVKFNTNNKNNPFAAHTLSSNELPNNCHK